MASHRFPQATTRDMRDLLTLARALRDRGRCLLTLPDQLRARARAQLACWPDTDVRLDPERRCRAQTELLATLSTLNHATEAVTALRPQIEELNAEIVELLDMAGPAANPVRMLLSRRSTRDAAQVATGHLRRFILSLSTVRFAVELRRRCAELDGRQPDPQWLWRDYQHHPASYQEMLRGLTEPEPSDAVSGAPGRVVRSRQAQRGGSDR